MSWRVLYFSLLAALTVLHPLPHLTLLPNESIQLPLAAYFSGNSLSYHVYPVSENAYISGAQQLLFTDSVYIDGCNPLGIASFTEQSEVYGYYISECGVSVVRVDSGAVEVVGTRELVGVQTWSLGNNSLYLVVNSTEIYAYSPQSDLQFLPTSPSESILKVTASSEYLIVLGTSSLSIYSLSTLTEPCFLLTTYLSHSLHFLDITSTTSFYALEASFGLLRIDVADHCVTQITALGNVFEGNNGQFVDGNDNFVGIKGKNGLFLLENSGNLTNFVEMNTNFDAGLSEKYMLLTDFNATNRLNMRLIGLFDSFVTYYTQIYAEIATISPENGYILTANQSGISIFSLQIDDFSLIISSNSDFYAKLLISSNFPLETTEKVPISVDILPFNSTEILHGSGITANKEQNTVESLKIYLQNGTFSGQIPVNSLFSGPNIAIYSLNETVMDGISVDSALLADPYVSTEVWEWSNEWNLGCSLSNTSVLVYKAGVLTELEVNDTVNVQREGKYGGGFEACVGVSEGCMVLTSANPDFILSLYTPNLVSSVAISLPNPCFSLKSSGAYLLCIGSDLLYFCEISLESCVQISSTEVISTVPFELYDAEFVSERVVALADGKNGLLVVDVTGLFTGSTKVAVSAWYGSISTPSKLLRNDNFLFLIGSNCTQIDISQYPNTAVRRILPITGFASTTKALISDLFVYASDGSAWEILDFNAVTSYEAQITTLNDDFDACLVLASPVSDRFLCISEKNMDILTVFTLKSPQNSSIFLPIHGNISDFSLLPSLSTVFLPLNLQAESSTHTLNTSLTLHIHLQGYYIWTPFPSFAVNIDKNATFYVDLRTFFYGKLVRYEAEGNNLGAELVTNMENVEINWGNCEEKEIFAVINSEKIAFLENYEIEICEINGNYLKFLTKFDISSEFPVNCTSISGVFDGISFYFSLICTSNSLSFFTFQLKFPFEGANTTESVLYLPIPSAFPSISTYLSNNAVYSVSFTPLSRLFYVWIWSLEQVLVRNVPISTSDLSGTELVIRDLDGVVSESGALRVYVVSDTGRLLGVEVTNSTVKVVASRDVEGYQVRVCGERLLVVGDRVVYVTDLTGEKLSEVEDWEVDWTSTGVSCGRDAYGEYAAVYVETETGYNLAVLGFRSEPASSLLALFPTTSPAYFLSSTVFLYHDHSQSYLVTITPPLLRLSPVNASVSGVYTVQGWNAHTEAVAVEFWVNRTNERGEKQDWARVSQAGWWVWALIGVTGVAVAVTTMVVLIRRRRQKRNLPSRRSINISLNPLNHD